MSYPTTDSTCYTCEEKPWDLVDEPLSESITVLLSRVNHGDRTAFDQLVPLVYQELHRIAQRYFQRELPQHTLQPTALIHETYVRLVRSGCGDFQSRKHFFVVAAKVMRQILVDHARARDAAKRGSGLTVMLSTHSDVAPDPDRVVIRLHDALDTLSREDEQKARLVEMRFFGGLTAEEIADCLKMPVHTVRRELRTAQAWLRQEVGQ
jgi:RNA polymerase sigma factor (TIGR02999 family)